VRTGRRRVCRHPIYQASDARVRLERFSGGAGGLDRGEFRAWSDCDGDVERRFSKNELLTNLTIYWATQTIHSSMRIHYEVPHNPPPPTAGARVEVPTGFAIFPKDLVTAPREWGVRFFDVRRWTEIPRGGHFAAMEEPELLAEDIRTFFRPLR
jgi:pimeloyl-ACP methyl ester carboxylesterase